MAHIDKTINLLKGNDLIVMIWLITNMNEDGICETTLSLLSDGTGLSYRQIRTSLGKLKILKYVNCEATKVNTLITICDAENYKDNQRVERQRLEPLKSGKGTQQKPHGETLDYAAFCTFFNDTMKGRAIKPISQITDKRKGMLNARMREFGKQALATMVKKAADSSFLNGRNNNGWTASFDWLFLPTNFPKVLEGKYDNREQYDKRDSEVQRRQEDVAGIIARLAAEDDANRQPVWGQGDIPE